MNLDGISVNHQALDQAASDMLNTVKQIDDRMQRLEGDLKPLRSQWAGEAQNQYRVAKAKWDGAIQDMRDLLNETHIQVTNSNNDYRQADRRGRDSFMIG